MNVHWCLRVCVRVCVCQLHLALAFAFVLSIAVIINCLVPMVLSLNRNLFFLRIAGHGDHVQKRRYGARHLVDTDAGCLRVSGTGLSNL